MSRRSIITYARDEAGELILDPNGNVVPIPPDWWAEEAAKEYDRVIRKPAERAANATRKTKLHLVRSA